MQLLSEQLKKAYQYHLNGNFTEAERLYQEILQVDPAHTEALNLMCILAHQVGKPDAADQISTRVNTIHQEKAAFYNNLGIAVQRQGLLPLGVNLYLQALHHKAEFP